ncbi:MAG: serine/threonine protein kinase [Deltaproteobacteria bacterium]|nr:serine/threonine protein kinase [Deltaproteobacteria bacterium]
MSSTGPNLQWDPVKLRELPRKGDKIAGRYRVESLVGLGGMGAVLSAMHVDLKQRVAVKVMLPQGARHRMAVVRFLREARAASAIQSEHVVRIFDVGKLKSGLPYLVMEYLSGASLSDVIEKTGPVPIIDGVHYVLQACEAVAQAHAVGIVHRDLKPSNLFLTRRSDGSPLVKVLDFGISKAEWMIDPGMNPALTATADLVGTPTYMSPEQVRSAKNVDWRTDIWSMGAVLYELITGKPPFWADTLPALAAMIVSDPIVPPSQRLAGLPTALDAILLRCMSKDPAERPQTIPQLAREIEPFAPPSAAYLIERISRVGPPNTISGSPGEPPPDMDFSTVSSHNTAGGWGTTAHESASRHRMLLATAAAVSLSLAVVVVALFLVLRGKPAKETGPPVNAASGSATSAPSASDSGPMVQPETSASTSVLAPGPSSSASSAPSAPKPPKPKRGGPRVDPFDDRY